MRGHLAAVDRIHLAHFRFDMGVPRLRDHGLPIAIRHKVKKRPDHAWVVDDLGAGVFRQEGGGQKPHHIFAVHKSAGFVKKEAAVKIAVPCHAKISPFRNHAVGGLCAVFRQKRVRDAVWKATIRRVIVQDELERRARLFQLLRDHVKRRPGHAIACIDHDLHRLQCVQIHKGNHTVRIGVARVLFGVAALRFDVAKGVMLAQDRDVAQPVCSRDRPRALAHHFDAIVINRVMRGRDHQPAASLQMRGREIHFLGAAKPNVDDVHALVAQAACQGLGQFRRGRAHVIADHHRAGGHGDGKATSDFVGDIRVELLAQLAAYVVAFETAEHLTKSLVIWRLPNGDSGQNQGAEARKTPRVSRWP